MNAVKCCQMDITDVDVLNYRAQNAFQLSPTGMAIYQHFMILSKWESEKPCICLYLRSNGVGSYHYKVCLSTTGDLGRLRHHLAQEEGRCEGCKCSCE